MTTSAAVSASSPLIQSHVLSYGDVEEGSTRVKESPLIRLLKCVGPGLMLGLANSNAGDLLAAAQSGAKYKFSYLPWILLLAVPLYMSTEIVTRVTVVKKTPLLKMIFDMFGLGATVCSVVILTISCIGGLVMQMCTFVSIAAMWGVSGVSICLGLTVVLVSLSLSDSVQRAEKIGIGLGLFECSFLVSAFLANPSGQSIVTAASSFSTTLQADHTTITGALIGAVLMPWMFFYQSSAVNRNMVTEDDLGEARLDIGLGTCASQLTMGGILVTFAVAMPSDVDLDTVPFADVPSYLVVALPFAKVFFTLGMMGASFVASLAIALTISWAVEEVFDIAKTSDFEEEYKQKAAKIAFSAAVMGSCVCSLTGIKAIFMIMFCDIVNSLTVLPLIIAILCLCHTQLTNNHKLDGSEKLLTFAMLLFVGVCGLYASLCSLYTQLRANSPNAEDVQAFFKGRPVASLGNASADFWDPCFYFAVALILVTALFLTTRFGKLQRQS